MDGEGRYVPVLYMRLRLEVPTPSRRVSRLVFRPTVVAPRKRVCRSGDQRASFQALDGFVAARIGVVLGPV